MLVKQTFPCRPAREVSPLDVLLEPVEPGSVAWLRQRRSQRMTLAAAAVFCFFIGLGYPSIESASEAQTAEIVREMIERGDWFIPHLHGEPCISFASPLYPWLALGFSLVMGEVSIWSIRLPAVIFGIGLVMMVYRAGRKMWSETEGFVAGMILLSTYAFIRDARIGTSDTLFSLGVFLGLSAYLRVVPIPRVMLCLSLAIVLAVKGPLGLIVLAVFGWVSCWSYRNWSAFRCPLVWLACLVGIGTGALWHGLASIATEQEFQSYWMNFESWNLITIRPLPDLWHTLRTIGIEWAPWIYLAPFAVLGYWPLRRKLSLTSEFLTLLWGVVLTFLLLWLFASKNESHWAALYPPLALMLAKTLTLADRDPWLRYGFDAFGILLIAGGLGAFAYLRAWLSLSDGWMVLLLLWHLICGAGLLCLGMERHQRPRVVILGLCIAMTVPIVVCQIIPAIPSDGREMMFAGRNIRESVPEDAQLYMIARDPELRFDFYAGRSIPYFNDWDSLMAKRLNDPAPYYVLSCEDSAGKPPTAEASLVATWRMVGGSVWQLWRL